MNFLRQTMKSLLSAVLPSQLIMVRGPVREIEKKRVISKGHSIPHRKIALTFDDGPDPEHTPRLLDQLAAAEIPATFFVVGEKAEQHPELIHRIVSEGHELGNHTYSHGEPDETSTKVFLDEVRRTRLLLQDMTGQDCNIVRPPKGKLTAAKLLGLWKMAQTVVLWNVDPRDYAMAHLDEMRNWSHEYQANGGDIVLMHDNHRYAEIAVQAFANQQCLHFGGLADFARAKSGDGICFEKISDWLTARPLVEQKRTKGAAV